MDIMTSTYTSEFSERYGSPRMRSLFSDEEKHAANRRIWYALSQAQHDVAGFGTEEELADLQVHITPTQEEQDEIRAIDNKIRHDTTAGVRVYSESAPLGGKLLHRGATSRDIDDNRDMMRIREATDIIVTRLASVLESYLLPIEQHAYTPCISWTHHQPAGIITVGYRLANYAQELLMGLEVLDFAQRFMKGKGVKGIDGASTGYQMLLGDKATPKEMEKRFLEILQLNAYPVTRQVYPRIADYITLTTLSTIAGASYTFANDIIKLASPPFSEMGKEPEPTKVGSSDAPWKIYNQTNAERILALGAFISGLPQTAWINAATNPLEGAVHDSANRRVIIPEAFLAMDELLMNYDYILSNLGFWEGRERNLRSYGSFMNVRELLIEAAKKGANRTELHERITERYQKTAWEQFRATGINPLPEMLQADEEVTKYLSPEEVSRIMNTFEPEKHAGDAGERTIAFLRNKLHRDLMLYEHRFEHVFPEF